MQRNLFRSLHQEDSDPGLQKIVSGGQTGVDQAALEAAIQAGLEHGGWCPLGRRSEDGRIDEKFSLSETESRNYAVRTEKNVIDSDGTLILFHHQITGGTLLTRSLARKLGKPVHCQDIAFQDASSMTSALDAILAWIVEWEITTLNVAGPRESSNPGIKDQSNAFLLPLFSQTIAKRTNKHCNSEDGT